MRSSTLPLRQWRGGGRTPLLFKGSLSTKRIADLALERRLPAASTTRAFADAGGLMSYGAGGPAVFRQGAKVVHRILPGQKPGGLPIQEPTKIQLSINLKTAKANCLEGPPVLLSRSDE